MAIWWTEFLHPACARFSLLEPPPALPSCGVAPPEVRPSLPRPSWDSLSAQSLMSCRFWSAVTSECVRWRSFLDVCLAATHWEPRPDDICLRPDLTRRDLTQRRSAVLLYCWC